MARLLDGVEAPWCVAAGWAIDLFLGEEHRPHDDLDLAMPRERFHEVEQALAEYELFVPVGNGQLRPLTPATASLGHQAWVRDRATGLWRVDVFREPHDGDTWICRRDERIRMPYAELIERTPEGIPYCRPEIVLLFKAKAARAKDDDDLAAVVGQFEPRRIRLLVELLEKVHPGHRWLARLA